MLAHWTSVNDSHARTEGLTLRRVMIYARARSHGFFPATSNQDHLKPLVRVLHRWRAPLPMRLSAVSNSNELGFSKVELSLAP